MLKNKFRIYKSTLLDLNNFVFQVFLVGYLSFLIIDYLREGFIGNFFNTGILLIICIASGMLAVVFKKYNTIQESPAIEKKLERKDHGFIIILTIISASLILLETKEIGWPGYIVSLIIGILIYLTSVLLLDKSEERKD